MRKARLALVAMGAAAVIVAVACSNDNGTGPGSVNLSGLYDLVSLSFSGFPAPGSSGTLAFTSDSFQAAINVVSPDTSLVPDTTIGLLGTYQTKSTDSIYLILPLGLGTIGGRYQVTGSAKDTLILNLNFPATPPIPFTTVWHKGP
jgi:hypothetical protein